MSLVGNFNSTANKSKSTVLSHTCMINNTSMYVCLPVLKSLLAFCTHAKTLEHFPPFVKFVIVQRQQFSRVSITNTKPATDFQYDS